MASRAEDEAGTGFSSPACSMHEVDDAYMGYADREALLAFLNELLEAERAGARVPTESARAAEDDAIAGLMLAIRRDEARWCAMLARRIKAMGGVPSTATGAFHAKAMAIADPGERLVLLNRGQGRVVRKLRDMLPRVRDDGLHADLADMLRSHESIIALAEAIAARSRQDAHPGGTA